MKVLKKVQVEWGSLNLSATKAIHLKVKTSPDENLKMPSKITITTTYEVIPMTLTIGVWYHTIHHGVIHMVGLFIRGSNDEL